MISPRFLLIIGTIILIGGHVFGWYRGRQWRKRLEHPPVQTASWLDDEQSGYLHYLRGDRTGARTARGDYRYDLGTLLAQISVVSGVVSDTALLAQAEQTLSGVVVTDPLGQSQLAHNLETVRALLAQQQDGNEDTTASGDSASTTGGESLSGEAETAPGGSSPSTQQGASLSPATQQQLEQYAQQLEAQQLENQQFFGKEQQGEQLGDPFDLFNQFFGQPVQLEQEVEGEGEKDR